ncbi:retropepsin-like aspartic protease [Hyunsoonleella rubra]|uniref:Retropepsin-like aspartic protease n=1 Tax=Hyunsoonleella rubra TaxID=1737062 RepID=A0ABW5TGN0_9FLAO
MRQPILTITLFFLYVCNTFANGGYNPPILFSKAEILNENTTRIPFKLVDHLMVVEAELLDQKGNFIIDTGSEAMILNRVHFGRLYDFQRNSSKTSGVNQVLDHSYRRYVKEFDLNGFVYHDKVSDVIDLSHIESSKKIKLLGIIGYNILKDYEVFIDLYLNQITLTKVDKFGNKLNDKVYLEKIVDSIDFTLKKHTIVVNGFINNQKVKLGIDTGAEFNQINKSVNRKARRYFIPKKRLKLQGVSGKSIHVLAGKLHRVKLNDNIYFGPMFTVLTNLNAMNEAFGTQLDGILGYEFFAQKRTIINYQKEKLYFITYPLSTQ